MSGFFSKLVLIFVVAVIFYGNHHAFAQEDKTSGISHFSGNVSVTNNGLSLIPAFSLNRPAAIFELSLGGERLSFDPEMRFALDGQPW